MTGEQQVGGDGSARYATAGDRVMVHDYGDEVVVANLTTGWFYSLTGTHRSVWAALLDGHSPTAIHHACEPLAREHGVLAEVLTLSIDSDLLVVVARDAPTDALAPIAWQQGGIESFDDLQDALLLDPVHEVSAEGWPYVASGDA
ncbi:MAG: hypothetical protein Q7V62_00065 [Actinomycetota bacterium]|nr:hypothetical protein [Actinomycetota bacterium]